MSASDFRIDIMRRSTEHLRRLLPAFILTALVVVSPVANASIISVGTIDNIVTVDTISTTSMSATCGSSAATSSCFYNYDSASITSTISASQLDADLTDALISTYVYSVNPASIDFRFNNTSIYNGAGADLVFFLIGNTERFQLDLLNDANGAMTYAATFSDIVRDSAGNWFSIDGASLTAVFVDLDDFGYANDQALANFRVTLGDQLITNEPGSSRPYLSLVGGFHTQPAISQIPLPLPFVLFSSGLALLGLYAKRKRN